MKRLTIILFFLYGIVYQSYSQTSKLNSFLDIELGTTLQTFLKSNPNAKKGTFWVLHTDISANNMIVYSVERTTSSGDDVKISCCFYTDALSIISVEYIDWQSGKDFYNALVSKYGDYKTYNIKDWRDFTNGQSRTTESFVWENNSNILNFIYTKELGLVNLLFANKATQQELKNEEQKRNRKKIE